MKGPIEYQTPWLQQRLLTEGTREQLIVWLCWNDPNGVYRDRDCDAEGISRLTLERARDIMRDQISR